MKKVDWNGEFTGVDGVTRSGATIIDNYVAKAFPIIEKNLTTQLNKLTGVRRKSAEQKEYIKILNDVRNRLKDLLRLDTHQIENERATWENQKKPTRALYSKKFRLTATGKKKGGKKESNPKKNINEHLLAAFAYDRLRNEVLPEISAQMNIKACLYCNQQFTLYLNYVDPKSHTLLHFSAFQFDHFFPKKDYPTLSATLCNLVPSCPVCNNIKRDNDFAAELHPYSTDLDGEFRLRVKDPTGLIAGIRPRHTYALTATADEIEIELSRDGITPGTMKVSDNNLYNYSTTLHIAERYRRHRDIALEVAARSYVKKYYAEAGNFGFIKDLDADLLRRIANGNYCDRADINRRPLAKLYLDLQEQFDEFLSPK